MPTFFFHATEAGQFIPDLDGIALPDLAAARAAAIEGANGLITEAVQKGIRDYRGRFDIEDELGDTVLTLTFACAIAVEITPGSAEQIQAGERLREGRRC